MINKIKEFSERFINTNKSIIKNNDRVEINGNISKWYYYNTDIVTMDKDKNKVIFNLSYSSISTLKRLNYAVSALNLKYSIVIKNGMYAVRNENNEKLEIKNNLITLPL